MHSLVRSSGRNYFKGVIIRAYLTISNYNNVKAVTTTHYYSEKQNNNHNTHKQLFNNRNTQIDKHLELRLKRKGREIKVIFRKTICFYSRVDATYATKLFV